MVKHVKWVTREKAKVDRIASPALYAYSKDREILRKGGLFDIALYIFMDKLLD